MKKNKAILTVFVVGIVLSLLCSGKVSADTIKNSLTVSPPNRTIILTPGEVYEGAIKISSQSNSNVPTHYEVSVGPFSQEAGDDSKDDYGNINYIDSSTYNQIVDWINIKDAEVYVKPNETNIVSFTINVPNDAPAGGQYASLIVKDVSSKDSVGGGVAVQNIMQILSITYAEVAGETRQEGAISENMMSSFLFNSPLEASSMVKNTGNVHTFAEYTLQVWPLFSNEEICTNEEDPEKSFVLPDTERYHLQTCNLPPFGIFRAKQVVKLFGKTSVLEKTIIVCPLWLLFVIVAVIIALVFWIVFRIKNNKRVNKSDSSEE